MAIIVNDRYPDCYGGIPNEDDRETLDRATRVEMFLMRIGGAVLLTDWSIEDRAAAWALVEDVREAVVEAEGIEREMWAGRGEREC